MKHIVFFSGGISSYCAAKRVITEYGKENVILLFTDTKIEEKDLYRFLDEASAKLEAKLIKIADGRTPYEIYKDQKFLGNNRIAPCSHILKQKTAQKYIKEHFKPDEAVLYLGLDWTEPHRFESPRKHWQPYKVEYPMAEAPYLSKLEMQDIVKQDGIEIPRLYKLGFAHNNCGGFCCRAGQGHFARLYKNIPEKYQEAENEEEVMRKYLNKDIAYMKKTENKVTRPYTLRELRQDIEKNREIDLFDIGGCGCFVD